MVEYFDLSFSQRELLTGAIVAVLVYLVLHAISYIVNRIAEKRSLFKKIAAWGSFVKLLIWSSYFLWIIEKLATDNTIIAFTLFLLFFMLMAWTTWTYVRDIIAGIIFQNSNNFKIGDTILFQQTRGKITHFNTRHLVVEMDDGSQVITPYTALSGKELLKLQNEDAIKIASFQFEIKRTTDPHELKKMIIREILNQPFVALNRPPIVTMTHKSQESLFCEITIYCLNEQAISEIKQHIIDTFTL